MSKKPKGEFRRRIETETIGDLKKRLKKLKYKLPGLEEKSMGKITMREWVNLNDRIDKNMSRQRKIRKKIREKRIKR